MMRRIRCCVGLGKKKTGSRGDCRLDAKKYYIFTIMSLIKVCPHNIPDTQPKFGVDCMKLSFFPKKNIPPMVGKIKLT